jgi:hypothetical protein
LVVGRTANPIKATAHNHGDGFMLLRMRAAAMVREVVVTATVNGEALVALTFTLAGETEHIAPLGAPVHVSVAEPLHPPPPIESA